MGEREPGDKEIWDAVFHHIKHHGRVTYVEWPFPYSEPWIFQYSLSCLVRIENESGFVSLVI